ncbi:MAG: hypothetical protein ACT4OK_06740 [Gemmobacter sp.]
MTRDEADPKGLVRESYAIEGITAAECRSVFMDWAMSLKNGEDVGPPLAVLIAHYGAMWPDHPMTQVLHEGAAPAPEPRRRGGRAARVGG